jgi:hypothetical protein
MEQNRSMRRHNHRRMQPVAKNGCRGGVLFILPDMRYKHDEESRQSRTAGIDGRREVTRDYQTLVHQLVQEWISICVRMRRSSMISRTMAISKKSCGFDGTRYRPDKSDTDRRLGGAASGDCFKLLRERLEARALDDDQIGSGASGREDWELPFNMRCLEGCVSKVLNEPSSRVPGSASEANQELPRDGILVSRYKEL